MMGALDVWVGELAGRVPGDPRAGARSRGSLAEQEASGWHRVD